MSAAGCIHSAIKLPWNMSHTDHKFKCCGVCVLGWQHACKVAIGRKANLHVLLYRYEQ